MAREKPKDLSVGKVAVVTSCVQLHNLILAQTV